VYARGVGQSVADLSRDFAFRIDHELYIDNAFVSMYAGNVSIRAGRQQLSWGPGYAWNPSDIFQDKNVLDPTYEKRGADAVSISIPTSSLGRITGVIGIEKDWNRAKKAIRWRTHLSGFDVTFLAMETHERFIDYDDFHDKTSRRRMIGGDFSGTLGEFGVWMESTWSDVDDGPDYLQALVGIDHTTESGLYLLAEYYHNGKGKKERSLYDFNAWMSLISSTGDHLGRDYLFIGQSYPLSDLLTGSVFTIISVTDASAVLYPNLEYSLSDNAVLTVIGYATAGKGDSEFGSFGWGAIVRARLYF
jgi:hypothetical protein